MRGCICCRRRRKLLLGPAEPGKATILQKIEDQIGLLTNSPIQ